MLHFLKMLKEKGKKLFLLTNSPFNFVDGGMRFMLQVFFSFSFLCTILNHSFMLLVLILTCQVRLQLIMTMGAFLLTLLIDDHLHLMFLV